LAATRRSALVAACWVSAAGYAICAIASLFLPSRAQVHAHLEAVERELAAAEDKDEPVPA